MKLGISSRVFQGWSLYDVFPYAARIGYDAVEIVPRMLDRPPAEIPQSERERVKSHASSAGIGIVGLHSLLVWPEGFHICHPDSEVRRRTQAHLQSLIDLCADIGGTIMVHGSGSQRAIDETRDPQEAWSRARETFRVCSEAARQRGVVYCLEPLRKLETNFINTVEEALRMVEEIDSPSFKIAVDCHHTLLSESVGLPQTIRRVFNAGQLGHVHLNDITGSGPGFGRIVFTPVIRTLMDIGYRGYASVEVFGDGPDPATVASRCIGYIRGIIEASTVSCPSVGA